ncbi:MAG: HAD-IC family P-type ATPase, partial [Pseudomonadota bacterium]
MADRPSPSTNAGLSQQEAQARLERDGPNELSQAQGRNLLHIALEVAKEPMFQLLVAAGLIYLALGDLGEALMLLAFVTITIGITIFQERRSEKVLETLRDLTSPRATVIRDGLRQQVAGRDLVLGDLIALTEGERIPADAVLLSANDLMTDESLLTGESASVSKVVQTANVPAARPGGDNLPFVYSGSMVVRGQGLAEVTATGARSEIGKIGSALAKIKDEATPLNQQMRRLVRIFSVLGLTLSVIVVLLFGLTRGHWLNGVLAGITLAMSMLPQEFLLILTVFMVMGSWRLSQHRVLARRSATIETLGAATVLCTDKTGTLTANRMSIAQLEADGHVWTSDQADLPEEVHRLMEYGILASEVDPFDPMEVAFVELGQQHLRDTEHLHATWMLAYEYGLSPDMLAMSHLWKAADQASHIIAAKGAPEAIADLCHLPAEQLA